jgi:hypothetical protein
MPGVKKYLGLPQKLDGAEVEFEVAQRSSVYANHVPKAQPEHH